MGRHIQRRVPGMFGGRFPLTNYTHIYTEGNSDGTETSQGYVFDYPIAQAGGRLMLPFGNTYGGSTLGANPITVRAQVLNDLRPSVTGIVRRALTFNGAPEAVIAPGGFGIGELDIDVFAGNVLSVFVEVSVETLGMTWPLGRLDGHFTDDATASGGVGDPVPLSGGHKGGYHPLGIWGFCATPSGRPSKPVIGAEGDSILAGDPLGTWLAKLVGLDGDDDLNDTSAVLVTLAQGGEGHDGWTLGGNEAVRGPLLDGCDYLLNEFGVNDANSAYSYARIASSMIQTGLSATFRGVRAVRTTLTPYAGLVPAAKTVRDQLNAWLRAGMPIDATTLAPVAIDTAGALLVGDLGHPYIGVLDVAAVVETATGSNTYKPGYSGDSIHPNATANAAIAADATIRADAHSFGLTS